jgi:hypothetical protein
VTRLKWTLDSIRLEIVLMLTQDRSMVCAEDTIDSKIILDTIARTPRSRGSCGVNLFGESVSIGAR